MTRTSNEGGSCLSSILMGLLEASHWSLLEAGLWTGWISDVIQWGGGQSSQALHGSLFLPPFSCSSPVPHRTSLSAPAWPDRPVQSPCVAVSASFVPRGPLGYSLRTGGRQRVNSESNVSHLHGCLDALPSSPSPNAVGCISKHHGNSSVSSGGPSHANSRFYY